MSETRKLEMTAEAIVKAPALYGIAFVRGNPKKDGKVYRDRLLLHVADEGLFRAAFPEYARERLEASVRIASQAQARNTLPDAEVMLANARMLLGERVSKPALRFGCSDGTMFATREEATAHAAELVAAEVARKMRSA